MVLAHTATADRTTHGFDALSAQSDTAQALRLLGEVALGSTDLSKKIQAKEAIALFGAERFNLDYEPTGRPSRATRDTLAELRRRLHLENPMVVDPDASGVDDTLIEGLIKTIEPDPPVFGTELFNQPGSAASKFSVIGSIASHTSQLFESPARDMSVNFGIDNRVNQSTRFDESLTGTLARYSGSIGEVEFSPATATDLGALTLLRVNAASVGGKEHLAGHIPKHHEELPYGESPVFASTPGGRIDELNLSVTSNTANRFVQMISDFQSYLQKA